MMRDFTFFVTLAKLSLAQNRVLRHFSEGAPYSVMYTDRPEVGALFSFVLHSPFALTHLNQKGAAV